ncbi:MAG: hypothetical protein PHU80_05500, partial [Kiritimatiellae bacterium]|nr:hypothetical protein [Kiritimatiellia bacterium]
FDLSTAGRTTQTARTAALLRPPEAYQPAPPEPELPLAEDFETLALGQGLPGWHLASAGRNELVQVTDQTAASGQRSLRVTDNLDNYEPHLYTYPVRQQGPISFAFDLRVGEGAQPSLELRDVDPWYSTGPMIVIGSDSLMRGANGKVLFKIPHNVWMRVELRTVVGDARDGLYEVRVRLPGQDQFQTFSDLPCAPGFKHLGWVGFCSGGTIGSVYEIDNIVLTP